MAQPQCELADACRDERLEPLTPAAREHRGRPCARYRDEHGIAVHDGGYDDPRGFPVVDHVDGYRARLAQRGDPAIRCAASRGDDGKAYAHEIVGDEFSPHDLQRARSGAPLELGDDLWGDEGDRGARSLEQSRLAQGDLTAADDEDLLQAQIEEERKVLQGGWGSSTGWMNAGCISGH